MTDHETPSADEPSPTYIIFILVFFFFMTGLLGFLICHLLKEKGYRCELENDEDDCEDKLGEEKDDESDDSQDTVEQILKCIIENEANMEAFKDMMEGQNVCELHDPRLHHKDSIGGLPLHHHTVHLGAGISSCAHCMQGHLLKTRRRSRVAKSKTRQEQTVFSVGRFRVTHTEKKNSLQGSINLPNLKPGDVSNDTTLSGIKDALKIPQEEYNIRNMFKDTGATNGKLPNAGKRKKSIPLLAFNKGINPVATKAAEGLVVDKKGQTTAEHLPVSLEKCSSTPVSSETALDECSKNESAHIFQVTVHESSPDDERADSVISQDKLDMMATGGSSGCSRFSVVQTEVETVITSAVTTEDREDDKGPNDNIKTDKVSQENIDEQRV
ncbi:RELT-like protein 2 [Triplophysa tibetana]|uniref:RELT-like protein 2 n=1 Tax=Triplophysa tibetana TaxID=1572043 RepID=A0A5A9NHC5_9TELE|nr:RELT-like protein 2 [Triplophysa tibetana]